MEFSFFFLKQKKNGNSDSFIELQFSMLSLDVGFSMLVLSVQRSKCGKFADVDFTFTIQNTCVDIQWVFL